ncbi:MAG: NUDIX hydrolase [Phycisphaerae bacterium]|nr:NUDIX hydrolase [Phycisphaerae bacterium]
MSSELIVTHSGPVFRVESVLVRDRDGRESRRDIVRHPGAVTVVAQCFDERFVMIRNARIAVAQTLLEFCAGKLERGEDPARAAVRELEEECGYSALRVEKLGTFYTSPGFADELMHVFFATNLVPTPRRLEPGEEIDIELVAADELERRIREGELIDGKSIAAWALWLTRQSGTTRAEIQRAIAKDSAP